MQHLRPVLALALLLAVAHAGPDTKPTASTDPVATWLGEQRMCKDGKPTGLTTALFIAGFNPGSPGWQAGKSLPIQTTAKTVFKESGSASTGDAGASAGGGSETPWAKMKLSRYARTGLTQDQKSYSMTRVQGGMMVDITPDQTAAQAQAAASAMHGQTADNLDKKAGAAQSAFLRIGFMKVSICKQRINAKDVNGKLVDTCADSAQVEPLIRCNAADYVTQLGEAYTVKGLCHGLSSSKDEAWRQCSQHSGRAARRALLNMPGMQPTSGMPASSSEQQTGTSSSSVEQEMNQVTGENPPPPPAPTPPPPPPTPPGSLKELHKALNQTQIKGEKNPGHISKDPEKYTTCCAVKKVVTDCWYVNKEDTKDNGVPCNEANLHLAGMLI